MTVDIICADAREGLARFPDGHFHCCVTSPPFWGLRDYGLEPTVWGPDCEHEWGNWQENHDEREATEHGKTRTTDRFYGDESRRFDGNHQKHSAGAFAAAATPGGARWAWSRRRSCTSSTLSLSCAR